MHEFAGRLPGHVASPLAQDKELEREFVARLADSSTLAFRVAFGVLRHHHDAEDVAQEAFARAYSGFARLRDRDAFRSWLVRMTWRLAIDRRRGDRRRMTRDYTAVPSGAVEAADAASIEQERAEKLWEAIDALPEKLRLPLVLAAIDGHTMREVGTLLGLPEGTVKSHVFDARRLLLEKLR